MIVLKYYILHTFMNISELLAKKTKAQDTLKSLYRFPKRTKILVAVNFSDIKLTEFLLPGLAVLPVNFLIFWDIKNILDVKNITYIREKKDFDLMWVDAILGNCETINIEKNMRTWVVPIINKNNYLKKILSEFQPVRGEGNAYLYDDNSAWSAYYALIRYIENHNFPYDNRNLVKNVTWV